MMRESKRAAGSEIRSQRYAGFASLDLAAIAAGHARPLAHWYLCRLLDRAGSGVILAPRAFPGATGWRVRRAGNGVFWTAHGKRLFLRGPAAVARHLRVRYVAGAFVAPGDWLLERKLATLRARLVLNAISLLRRGKPLRVSVAARLAGVTPRTLRRWARALGWRRITNLRLTHRIEDPRMLTLARRYAERGERLRGVRFQGEWWLAAQLPNTFRIQSTAKKRRAALRRINRKLPPYVFRGRGQRLYSTGERRSPKPTTQLHTLRGKAKAAGVQLWNPPALPPPLNTGDRIEMLIRRHGRREQVS